MFLQPVVGRPNLLRCDAVSMCRCCSTFRLETPTSSDRNHFLVRWGHKKLFLSSDSSNVSFLRVQRKLLYLAGWLLILCVCKCSGFAMVVIVVFESE
jgi:hypothetical protein